MTIYVPPESPPAGVKAPPRPPLTTEEQVKYEEVFDWCVQELNEIPTSSESKDDKAPLSEEEKAWLTKECMLRYLRATKFHVEDAKQRIIGTLVWRREYLDGLTPELVSKENETGKQVILGYDDDARPCLYLLPARQNTDRSETQIKHLVFMLERVIDFMPSGQDTLALLIDFYKVSSGRSPSVGQGRHVLHILQTHYPERLGKAMVANIPWFVWTFLKIIHPFIDPLTREKLIYGEPLSKYIPEAQLAKHFGGTLDFEYDHKKYWPAMVSMAKAKHTRYIERWRHLGGKIGLSEFDLRDGCPNDIFDSNGKLKENGLSKSATDQVKKQHGDIDGLVESTAKITV